MNVYPERILYETKDTNFFRVPKLDESLLKNNLFISNNLRKTRANQINSGNYVQSKTTKKTLEKISL